MNEVDLGNPHRSLTTFFSVALNEFVKQAKILWTIWETCLNPGSPREQKKNHSIHGNLTQTFPHGPVIWKVMQRNVWSDIANWRTKQLNSYTKVATPCLDDHQFKEEEFGFVGRIVKTYAFKLF